MHTRRSTLSLAAKPPATIPTNPPTPSQAAPSSDDPPDFTLLCEVVERLLGTRDSLGVRVGEQVDALTGHRASLRLHPKERTRRIHSEMAAGACLYPVQFAGQTYGTLVVVPDSVNPATPALPDPQSQQLARVCAAVLCLLDQAALLHVLSHRLSMEPPEPLTRRQREVLALIARGLSDDEIVEALHISPETLRRHRYDLYARLEVHSACDLLLAAYQYGMVSYITPESTPPLIAGWR